ncbi:VWA domain-containing protein [Thalassotalea sp. PLHSN55]|uniref:vWA domain-containing protein n=1 Tax=Thalassotalea sp. PLHSN55 TaxID=3435888 RepID=UPI003F831DE8
MNDFIWLAPNWLWLLITPLLWLAIAGYQHNKKVKELRQFSQQALQTKWQLWPSLLMMTSLTFLSLALARPAWDPQPENISGQGRDIIFLLDVSRSMLAEDARPNRLAVAKHAIEQTVTANTNDRYGLVAFAGSASILSPLTNDHQFFNNLIANVTPDSVSQGGTRIEDALFKVIDKMIPRDDKARAVDIILISDGEDLGNQENRALDDINKLAVRLIVIGLGDSQFGARIPTRDGKGWVFDQGRELWSKMDTAQLKLLSSGVEQSMFFPVGTATFDLSQIITKLRQVWPGESHAQGQTLQYSQGYPYCLLIALLSQLLFILGNRKALFAGLAMLSFSSQAHAFNDSQINDLQIMANKVPSSQNQLETGQQPVTEHQALERDLSPQTLEKLSLTEQFRLAELLFEENSEQAAQVYRHISEHTSDLNTAITANYNLATSLIAYANQLSDDMALLTDPDNFDKLLAMTIDDAEIIDPEPYYQEATSILRLVLRYAPDHQKSAKNLEWLTIKAATQQQAKQQQNSQTQQSKKEQQNSDTESDDNAQKKQQKENNQDSSSQNDDNSQAQQQDAEQGETDMSNLTLPPPSASAEEIMQQAVKRDQQDRSQQRKKQSPVERDW